MDDEYTVLEQYMRDAWADANLHERFIMLQSHVDMLKMLMRCDMLKDEATDPARAAWLSGVTAMEFWGAVADEINDVAVYASALMDSSQN